jgi:hypothetical protein
LFVVYDTSLSTHSLEPHPGFSEEFTLTVRMPILHVIVLTLSSPYDDDDDDDDDGELPGSV